MKKESSFKLKSGNDLGKSAAKLMKQSPARAEEKPKLKQKIESAITSEQGKLEDKIKGFFGSLQKGFKTAKKKRDNMTPEKFYRDVIKGDSIIRKAYRSYKLEKMSSLKAVDIRENLLG